MSRHTSTGRKQNRLLEEYLDLLEEDELALLEEELDLGGRFG